MKKMQMANFLTIILLFKKKRLPLWRNSKITHNTEIINIMIGTQEILIIALVVILLFGGKKIPELMKGLGKGVKSFKDGMNGVEDEPAKPSDEAKKE